VLLEGDERAALLVEGFGRGRGGVVHFVLMYRRLDRLPRQAQQLVLLPLGQGKRRLLGSAMRRVLHESHRAITHHAALVAGRVAGIGVVQDLRVRGSQAFRRDHGGDDGISSAGFPNLRREVARHAQVVPLLDGLQRLVVDLDGVGVRVVVRKIAAGDDQGVGARNQFGQRQTQRAAGFITLVADDDGHQLKLPEHALQEGKLVFQRVLRLAGAGAVAHVGKLDERAQLHQFRREVPVHRNLAQGSGVSRAVVDRGETKSLVVRRCDHHHPVEFPALQQSVGIRRHLSGVLVAGVRRDQGDHVGERGRRRLGQETVDHGGERLWVGGVE